CLVYPYRFAAPFTLVLDRENAPSRHRSERLGPLYGNISIVVAGIGGPVGFIMRTGRKTIPGRRYRAGEA
ncbi:MAG: hypothetical protein ACM359_20370, partial [Bacillota bacterium]